ncbi:unnamed protein product, partial [Musa hybrid cultivar]
TLVSVFAVRYQQVKLSRFQICFQMCQYAYDVGQHYANRAAKKLDTAM